MSLYIWDKREGPGRALPVSEFGKKGTVSEWFSKPAPSMLSKRTRYVAPLCAEFGPVGREGHTRFFRVCSVEKLESNEEIVEEFYCLVLLFF